MLSSNQTHTNPAQFQFKGLIFKKRIKVEHTSKALCMLALWTSHREFSPKNKNNHVTTKKVVTKIVYAVLLFLRKHQFTFCSGKQNQPKNVAGSLHNICQSTKEKKKWSLINSQNIN